VESKRNVVITGAAGGVGSALVKRFLENGDTVLATDSNEAGLLRLRDQLGDPQHLLTGAADVASVVDTTALAETARATFGTVEILIKCAGFFPIATFDEMSVEDWKRVIDINLTGPYLMTRAFLPLMKERGWGRIINFGSASVFDGARNQVHYVSAKAGVVGLTRALAREVGQYGITVNVVTPGLTVTPTVRDHFSAELLEAQHRARAIQRDELPEDLVEPVFFLASPGSGFVSGQTINVDGGKFMR
jgi:NAD(P)-dependent dehydrogenase (short-subunit alcohol dehydrogenase family)